jgi:hypothetical protein
MHWARLSVLLSSLVCAAPSFAATPLELSVQVDPDDGTGHPSFTGTTNLPDGTEMLLTLTRRSRPYMGQDRVVVHGGHFRSTHFADTGDAALAGRFELIVTGGLFDIQPASIKPFLGKDYANFSGPQLHHEAFGTVLETTIQVEIPSHGAAQAALTPPSESINRWELLEAKGYSPSLYTDPSRVERAGSLVSVWFLQDMHFDTVPGVPYKPDANSFLSAQFRNQFNCSDNVYRTLFYATYSEHMGGGKRKGGPESGPWTRVPPSMAVYRERACGPGETTHEQSFTPSSDDSRRSVPTAAAPPSPRQPLPGYDASMVYDYDESNHCDAAETDVAKLICGDLALGEQELALKHRFNDVRLHVDSKLTTADYEAFLKERVEAARRRDETCHDKACLLDWYRGRSEDLRRWEQRQP